MGQAETTTVFLADRYDHFRDNLKTIFRRKNIEVIGEADAAEDLLEQLQKLKPQLLIVAHRLVDQSADEFLPAIKNRFPDLKILLLTLNCHKRILRRYIDYLDGMLCKLSHKEDLLEAIQEITQKDKLYFRINRDAEEIRDQRQNKIRP
jgi:DNA-binding NarL/FixJ family response regulator